MSSRFATITLTQPLRRVGNYSVGCPKKGSTNWWLRSCNSIRTTTESSTWKRRSKRMRSTVLMRSQVINRLVKTLSLNLNFQYWRERSLIIYWLMLMTIGSPTHRHRITRKGNEKGSEKGNSKRIYINRHPQTIKRTISARSTIL